MDMTIQEEIEQLVLRCIAADGLKAFNGYIKEFTFISHVELPKISVTDTQRLSQLKVDCLTLLVYDENGNYVDTRIVTGTELQDENYRMKLDLKQGNYHFVAYGGLACNKSSFLMKYTPGEGTGYTDLQVELDLECLTNPKRKNLHGLYWGELTLATADLYSEGTVEMMKNTNNIRVVLQQMNGEPVDDKKFEFEITDDNILFSYDNNLLENGMVTYTSWAQGQASAGFTDEGREVVVAYAELSTSRLMVRDWYSPKLTVRRKADGVEIINIPLINYLLMLRSDLYASMDSQEFLDHLWCHLVILILTHLLSSL